MIVWKVWKRKRNKGMRIPLRVRMKQKVRRRARDRERDRFQAQLWCKRKEKRERKKVEKWAGSGPINWAIWRIILHTHIWLAETRCDRGGKWIVREWNEKTRCSPKWLAFNRADWLISLFCFGSGFSGVFTDGRDYTLIGNIRSLETCFAECGSDWSFAFCFLLSFFLSLFLFQLRCTFICKSVHFIEYFFKSKSFKTCKYKLKNDT